MRAGLHLWPARHARCLAGRVPSSGGPHPDCAKAHKALGYYYLQEERVDEAIRECQEAVRLDPRYEMAHVELAVALGKAGRWKKRCGAWRGR